jgi:hypothetical protein
MKTKFRVMLVSIFLVLGIAVIYSTSCKKAVEKATGTCVPMASGCGTTIQVCANSTSAWYTYNGTTYNCNGTDCSSAAAAVLAAACPKKSPQELTAGIQQLLDLTEIARDESKANE